MRLEGSFFWVLMRSFFAMIQLMLSNGEKKINNKEKSKEHSQGLDSVIC